MRSKKKIDKFVHELFLDMFVKDIVSMDLIAISEKVSLTRKRRKSW